MRRNKGRHKLSGGIVRLVVKGEFRVGVTIGNKPHEGEPFGLDIYLFKFNIWVALTER